MNAQELKSAVSSFSDKPIVLTHIIAGRMNGDQLIREVTEEVLDGLEYDTLPFAKATGQEGHHVVIVGNGGFMKHLPSFGGTLRGISTSNDFTILPSTFEASELEHLKGAKHQVFCRERQSFEDGVAHGLNCAECPDTVLLSEKIKPTKGSGTVIAYRRGEGAYPHNGPADGEIIEVWKLSYEDWKRKIMGAAVVRTDYLHTAILAAMSGADVHLYRGSGHKQKGVWLANLKALGVRFYEH